MWMIVRVSRGLVDMFICRELILYPGLNGLCSKAPGNHLGLQSRQNEFTWAKWPDPYQKQSICPWWCNQENSDLGAWGVLSRYTYSTQRPFIWIFRIWYKRAVCLRCEIKHEEYTWKKIRMQLLTDGHAEKEGFRFIRASDRHAVFQTHTENPAH